MQAFKKYAYSFVLLCVLLIKQIDAWKPIIGPGQETVDHVYTTSYTLRQSHPDFDSKPYTPTDYKSSKPIHVSSTGLESEQELHIPVAVSVTPAAAKSLHINSYSDEIDDDFESVHPGYGLGEGRFFPAVSSPQCSLKKFAFNQDGTVVYNNKIPELHQYTICYWLRFTNHSGDHVILTYSTKNEPRAMQFWIANAKNVSYISMAIKGQQMYRLNYPFRMRHWHHTCSSWNGKTGEWQIWVKGERIGRGFHNSLVGHVIPAHGKLFSGGPSVTGGVCEGLHFEITLVQIYRIALSAGKAHRDHKHHHVHMVDYEGQEVQTTTRAPPAINRPQIMHNLLANGQIPARVRLNLARQAAAAASSGNGIDPNNPQLVTLNTNFVNGQMNAGALIVSQQLIGQPAGPQRPQISQRVVSHQAPVNSNPGNIQFVDESETHILFKRQTNATTTDDTKKKKRAYVYLDNGHIVHDSLLNDVLKYDGLAEFGGQKFKDDLNVKMSLEDEIAHHDREPAEEEVKAVMTLCSSCDPEPFKGAIVLAWKDVVEDLDNALKGKGSGKCGDF